MKDFIKEFGDDQSHKNLVAKHERRPVQKPMTPPNKIGSKDLKNFTTERILKYMNESIISHTKPCELLHEQIEEIMEKVKLYESRAGFMSMTFHDDKEKDECILGARVDPTNNKDWVLTKEEMVYKLPYAYKDSLYKLFNEIRKKV